MPTVYGLLHALYWNPSVTHIHLGKHANLVQNSMVGAFLIHPFISCNSFKSQTNQNQIRVSVSEQKQVEPLNFLFRHQKKKLTPLSFFFMPFNDATLFTTLKAFILFSFIYRQTWHTCYPVSKISSC